MVRRNKSIKMKTNFISKYLSSGAIPIPYSLVYAREIPDRDRKEHKSITWVLHVW